MRFHLITRVSHLTQPSRKPLSDLHRVLPLPYPPKGQVLVMDNLKVHKGSQARGLIEGVGCRVLFLLAYSSDFSLIEKHSQDKGILRKLEARTRSLL